MGENYLLLNVNDPKSRDVAEVLSNKTAKKILGLLAEGERSESELSEALGLPMNTIGYNIKKLKNAGLIEPANKFFWSVKGKKIVYYKLSNKKIVISPKESFKGLLPSVIASAVLAVAVPYFTNLYLRGREIASDAGDFALKAAPTMATEVNSAAAHSYAPFSYLPMQSIWFFFGAVVALSIFLVWNWRKIW